MLFNINLNTETEFICNESNWPKPCCDVQVISEDLAKIARLVCDDSDNDAQTEIYAVIDPERRLVTSFDLVCKKCDRRAIRITNLLTIKATSLADGVEYYRMLECQGKDKFTEFIVKSCDAIRSERCEMTGVFVDAVDDFLEERNVRIPTSDAELKEAGEWFENEEDNRARIYGSDYDDLGNRLMDAARLTETDVILDRIRALKEWSDTYDPGGIELFKQLRDGGFSPEQITCACGEEVTEEFLRNR